MSDEITAPEISAYLQYLPAIFQQDAYPSEDGTGFINQLLLAFEQILSGRGKAEDPGLEEIINRIHTYVEPGPLYDAQGRPQHTPAAYLPWLAGWVALRLRNDWSEAQKRRLISQIVILYRKRGTRAGLSEVLQTYLLPLAAAETGDDQSPGDNGAIGNPGVEPRAFQLPPDSIAVAVNDFVRPFQLNETSSLGVDSWIGGAPQNYFVVSLHLQRANPDWFTHVCTNRSIVALIDQYKPAHTYYDLYLSFPTMQIGEAASNQAILGENAGIASHPIALSTWGNPS